MAASRDRDGRSGPRARSAIDIGVMCGPLAIAVAVGLARMASAAADDPAPASAAPAASEIAAKVGGQQWTCGDVEREVNRALAGQNVAPAARQFLQAQALQQLVDRQIVLDYLQREGQAATAQEVDVAVQRLVARLTTLKTTLTDHLRKSGFDEAALRRQYTWQISWRKYLERYLTEDNVQKYFDQHRREFDGTQLRVAHILLKIDAQRPNESRRSAVEQAGRIAADIAARKLTFAQAAAQHSAAPTAAKGGDIGLISRRDPMPESFARAAYALQKGQVSEPVVTELGVHLITVLDEQPGQKTLKDVRSEVEPAVAQYMFQWLADRERPKASVEFTGRSPYFAPATGELVLPEASP